MQKLRSIEMLRAIAALLVVMFHAQGLFGLHTGTTPFGGLFVSGYRGVDLFFVISGFIIAHVHRGDIGHPARLRNYAFNRAARIYPAVWIMTALAIGLYAAGFGSGDKQGKLAGWSVTASLLLLPQPGDALVSVTWSLKYELFFYLVFAVMILNRRIGMIVMAGWQLAILVASFVFSTAQLGMEGFYLRSLCLDFSVGLACAWFIARPGILAGKRVVLLHWGLVVVGTAAFGCGISVTAYAGWAGVACSFGAGALITGLILLEQGGRIRIPGALVMLGGASYAIYLVHFSVITIVAVLLGRMHAIPDNDAVFLAGVAISVGAGFAFDRLLDHPTQRLLRQFVKPALLGNRQNNASSLPVR